MKLRKSTMLTTVSGKNKINKPDKSQGTTSQANQKGKCKISPQANLKKKNKYFFHKKKGHIKKECAKFKKWLKKIGNLSSIVYYESNAVHFNISIRWIDSRFSIYIANSLQGMQNLRKLVDNEQSILSGNMMGSHVEAIGTCILTNAMTLFQF